MLRYAGDYDWERMRHLRARAAGYGMEYGNWGARSGLYGAERFGRGRGYDGGWGMERLHRHTMRGGYDEGVRGGYAGPFAPRRRLTGMESNRMRGVYGSDFRAEEEGRGYGGGRGWWGPGRERGWRMNPGRGGGGRY